MMMRNEIVVYAGWIAGKVYQKQLRPIQVIPSVYYVGKPPQRKRRECKPLQTQSAETELYVI